MRNKIDYKTHNRGYRIHLRVLKSMLISPLWKQLGLSVHFFNHENNNIFKSIMMNDESCVNYSISSLNNITNINNKSKGNVDGFRNIDDIKCSLCKSASTNMHRIWICSNCQNNVHIICITKQTCKNDMTSQRFIPKSACCNQCMKEFDWINIVSNLITVNINL